MIPLLLNRWVQLAAGTAMALVLGFGLGHHQKTLEDASAALAGARLAVQVVAHSGAINSAVDQKAVAAITKAHANTITLIQKVPVYVPRKSDDQCIIGLGAVQLLDAAASGAVPAAPSGLPDADSGLALSQLVSDTIANAGTDHTLRDVKSSWEEWYDGQNPAWKRDHPAKP